VKFGTCLPVAEVICGRGNTCDAAERDSRNSMRMPFGADLTGGHSTAIPFQINNEIAIGRIAHFHEENNLGFENKNSLRIFRLLAPILCAAWLALCSSTSATPYTGRDTWQRPDEVMDAMEVHLGSTVADVGAGYGWFTHKLALRVGATGTVFAVDVQPAMVEDIRSWSVEEHLRQVIPVLGAENDPHLPDGQLDAVLVVNTYHEMQAYDAMLRSFHQALKPGGRLVIIEPEAKPGRPRAEYQKEHVIPPELVKEDATRNGFRFVGQHADVVTPDQDHWPFLVFEKPRPKAAPQ
jgi:predicted methyltransferase